MQRDWFMYHIRSNYKYCLEFPFKERPFKIQIKIVWYYHVSWSNAGSKLGKQKRGDGVGWGALPPFKKAPLHGISKNVFHWKLCPPPPPPQLPHTPLCGSLYIINHLFDKHAWQKDDWVNLSVHPSSCLTLTRLLASSDTIQVTQGNVKKGFSFHEYLRVRIPHHYSVPAKYRILTGYSPPHVSLTSFTYSMTVFSNYVLWCTCILLFHLVE